MAAPTTEGDYRIKIYQSSNYWQYVPASSQDPWIIIKPYNSSLAEQKWHVTPVSGKSGYFYITTKYNGQGLTISPVLKDRYWQHGNPIGSGSSARWRITKQGSYVKMSYENNYDVVDAIREAEGVVHFYPNKSDNANQRLVFEPFVDSDNTNDGDGDGPKGNDGDGDGPKGNNGDGDGNTDDGDSGGYQSPPRKVGIVGGGMAGLYAALMLRNQGCQYHIFEASGRLGGRIFTHRFTQEPNQYFEAGAMRIPQSDFHQSVFDLIEALNSYLDKDKDGGQDRKIELVPYHLGSSGNAFYINKNFTQPRTTDSSPVKIKGSDIKWDLPSPYRNKSAQDLLSEALIPLVNRLKPDFEKGFKELLQLDKYSFRYYLSNDLKWPNTVIDFVETVTSQTNQFSHSLVELIIEYMDFDTKDWFTIKNGMERFPQALAYIIGLENVTFGARVIGVEETNSGAVKIITEGYNGRVEALYDKVLLAIPPAALKMINNRPRWGLEKEMAIRSLTFEPLYKMGLRFKTRFWEQPENGGSRGGQSTTDLPVRWIVFPSNGIGTKGPGVLLIYSWMTDASVWTPLDALSRRNLAITCLAEFFKLPIETITADLIETFDVTWSTKSATGNAMFLPGQFEQRYDPARKPEKNIYFAGEHLSTHHTWISGALISAEYSIAKMFGKKESEVKITPSRPISQRVLRAEPRGAPMSLPVGMSSRIQFSPTFRTQFRTGDQVTIDNILPSNLGNTSLGWLHTGGAETSAFAGPGASEY